MPDGHVDAAAAVINAHPGVSHNYRRDHEFNLWWTVAVPPGEDLQAHVDALHRLSGATSTRVLPTLKLYKIGVDLDVSDQRSMAAQTTLPVYVDRGRSAADLEPAEVALLRELQEDLALESAPFASMAERLGISEDAVLKGAQDFIDEGLARRFAAVLHHRRAGFGANAMSVWKVPEDRTDDYGYELASYAAVSHCYRRPTYPDWPYALFGMIHATSKERVDEAVADIRQRTGLDRPPAAVLHQGVQEDQRALLRPGVRRVGRGQPLRTPPGLGHEPRPRDRPGHRHHAGARPW